MSPDEEAQGVARLRDKAETLARLVSVASEYAADLRHDANEVADAIEERRQLDEIARQRIEEEKMN
jgi:hypothetical protein